MSAPARRLALAAGVVCLLGACGQKGPLYLPTEPAAAGRATLPEILRPAGAASAPQPPSTNTGTGTANPIRTP